MSEQATPAVTNTASPANRRVNTRRLAETAIMIALATILSELKIIPWVFGGGITIFAMVPMIFVSYRWGLKWGFFSAFVFGILQLLLGVVKHGMNGLDLWVLVADLVLEYLLAYTLLGLGGLFRNKIKRPWLALPLGGAVAVAARYLVHFIAGVLIWGNYAEWFFVEDAGAGIGASVLNNFHGLGLAAVYSGIVNGSLFLGELIVTVIGLVIVGLIPAINKKMD